MNRIVLQFWEESVRGSGIRPSGCTIHIDSSERDKYIDSVFSGRSVNHVPEEYENFFGGPIVAFVEDSLFQMVLRDKSIRLTQYQLNNLRNMDEITLKEEI